MRKFAESCPAGRRLLGVAIAAFAIALLGTSLLVGPAIAGDAVAQFEFDQSEQEAEPGETVTVDVRGISDGGYADEGVDSYSFVVAVPPEVGEPVAVEPGPWLAQGDGEVEQTESDAGEGAIRIEHERVGAENGVTGNDVAATVTIELREDAPAADAVIVVADTDANLYGSDYRMQTFGDDATIAVDGGGERLEPAYDPGSTGDDSVGVVTAEDANRSIEEGGEKEANSNADDSLPGFGIVVGFGALLSVLGATFLARRHRRNDH